MLRWTRNIFDHKVCEILTALSVLLSVVVLVASVVGCRIPKRESYVYEGGKIITQSWHDVFELGMSIAGMAILVLAFVSTIISIVRKMKTHGSVWKQLICIWGVAVVGFGVVLISNIMVIGLWGEEDYSPSYYEFSNDRYTIVVEEKSFLLYGGGEIYQILDDNEAVVIGAFHTDDGGRNNGNYDVKWYDDYAEITYHTFQSESSIVTETVEFLECSR